MTKRLSWLGVVVVTLFVGPSVARGSTNDWLLPNSSVTPGAVNLTVTQSNIKQNICKSGWTTTVRPPSSYTTKLKIQQLASSYKGFVAIFGNKTGSYEEDHLIPLQLGGSPDNPKNLWPQPYLGDNARRKNVIGLKLKKLVCAGEIKLVVAQKAIASDWVAAYSKYVGAVTTTTTVLATTSTTSLNTTTTTVLATTSTTSLNTTKTTTISGSSYVTPGAFCTPGGATGYSTKGVFYTCKTSNTDSRNRWRQ